ncbi:hypothetical protein AAKU55_005546 [Oxalobacteraceae bacterium GrIS 1.11]
MSGIATAVVGAAVIGGIVANNSSKRAGEANQKSIDANRYQGEIASDQYEEYKTTYRPLEQALVKDATNYDKPEAYDKAAGEAQGAVSSQIGLARDRLSRTVGYDPTSAAAQAASVNLELRGAAMGAAAQNQARQGVTDKAYARKLDAVGLGKGLVTNASTGMASAAANASTIARNASLEAGQTASGVGAMVNGVVGGLSKINWGGSGTTASPALPAPAANYDWGTMMPASGTST